MAFRVTVVRSTLLMALAAGALALLAGGASPNGNDALVGPRPLPVTCRTAGRSQHRAALRAPRPSLESAGWQRPRRACSPSPDESSARHRVVVSTDIGGTDFDDFQSMVHLLLYADSLDIEGLISSPYGGGRKARILEVIDCYERDFPNLKTYSAQYPAPDALRAITRQGALESAGQAGFGAPTEGSDWIIQCARREDPRPLYLLVWGGIDDLAQALHDAPDILPKLRVYFIGGPNKKWSVNAYAYVERTYPTLWIIEANSTYAGWFTGGNQAGDWSNQGFVVARVAGHGALGDYFATRTRATIKMGDSPSVAYLLHGRPEDPSRESWGGQFVRAWERPHKVFSRTTTAADCLEQFGVLELVLPLGAHPPEKPEGWVKIENQTLKGEPHGKGAIRFLFSPKEAKVYEYSVRANITALDGKTGALTSIRPSPDAAQRPSPQLPNWWTDDPAPAVAEGEYQGAKTVNRWREDFLRDFAARLLRCQSPAPAGTNNDGAGAGILIPGEPLRQLASEFAFTEGPACDAYGNVFFTDQPNDRILEWSVEGRLTTFKQPCGRANGLCFDAEGNLWACADEKNELWRIDPAGKVSVPAAGYQGKLLNGPNDVWLRPGGGLYFTDPFYARPYWKRGPEEQLEGVYYLPADGKALPRVIEDMTRPNGIIGSPDGKTLYVSDIGAGQTWRYELRQDGSLTNKTLFCRLGSDGMTLDNEGNVYLTGKGVTVFNAAGERIERIPVPENWTANVCFGGKDRSTLFITASRSLYGIRLRVKGVGASNSGGKSGPFDSFRIAA